MKEAHVRCSPFARQIISGAMHAETYAHAPSAHKRYWWLGVVSRQKSEVGLIKCHARRRHVAAIAPQRKSRHPSREAASKNIHALAAKTRKMISEVGVC